MKKTRKKSKKRVIKKRKIKRIKKRIKKQVKRLAKRNRKIRKKPKKRFRKKSKKRVARKKAVKKRIKSRKRIKKKPKKRIKRAKKRVIKKPKIRRKHFNKPSLEQLFESPIKVQVMKLFFRNPEKDFLFKEAKKRLGGNLSIIRREMKRLEKIGLLKTKQISPRKQLFSINSNFDFFNELKKLILRASPVSKEKMLKAIKRLGRIKLVLLSGLFASNQVGRADLLIVGDNINSRKLNAFIKNLETEVGGEVRCVAMTTEEFRYRYDMYDRFIRDLLNEKCEFLVNRLKI